MIPGEVRGDSHFQTSSALRPVNRLSATPAARAITSASELGLASVTPCVSVMKGA